MRFVIAAVGRLKEGPERELLERYRKRFGDLGRRLGFHPIVWHELSESRASTAAKRCAEEGMALLERAADADAIIALDERGRTLTSPAFAHLLAQTRDSGADLVAILVGGPDGLSPEVREAARTKVAFGAMTLPHGLARIVLAEQLYRAATILAGHPYHRA
jgi:23S rRNA (pseudouridine1915-N3)-methyltransferase